MPGSTATAVSSDFHADARGALGRLRAALTDLLHAVQADPNAPQEMSRRFKLNKNLAWKLSRIVRETDPYAAVAHLPGTEGWKIALRSLAAHGAPPSSVDALRQGINELERVLETHSGDRATLGLMAGQFTRDIDQQQSQMQANRKLAFRGNSAIWGVQARVQLSAHFVAPARDGSEMLDLAIACGLLDFTRLRGDVPWAVATVRQISDVDEAACTGVPEAIDPESRFPEEAPVIREFCSTPVPAMHVVRAGANATRFEIAEGPVGKKSAVSCVLGWVYRSAVSRYQSGDDRHGMHFVSLSTPVELLYHDLFVHRDLAFALDPKIYLYSQLPGGPVFPQSGLDRGLLPTPENVVSLGSQPPEPVAAEVSRYPQLVGRVIDRLGYSMGEFHGFRFRMRFPPIPTLAVFRYELPTRP